MRYRNITTTIILLAAVLQIAAQGLSDRYNKKRPVTIFCSQDNPPYEFLNDKGKPAGCNVDIIEAVMEDLGLPCKIVMEDQMTGYNAFVSGQADLILADGRNRILSSYVISENVFSYTRIREDSIAEIHFIGKDRQLIEQIDDQYSRLKQSGDIAEIQDRWLHPERVHSKYNYLVFYIAAAILLLAAFLYLLNILVRRHVKYVTRNSRELKEMMTKVLHMGNYDVMVYDIKKNRVTNQYGNILPQKGITLEEFIQRIHPDQREEFILKSKSLHEGRIRHFELNKRWNQGTEERPHYLNFQGHAISELDENGRPAYVINAVHDVTHEVEVYKAARDIEHKYEVILSDPFVAISLYDSNGFLIDHNEAMNQLLCGIDDSLFKEIFRPVERKDMHFSRHLFYPEYGIDRYVDCHIQPLYNAVGKIANYLVTTTLQTKAT